LRGETTVMSDTLKIEDVDEKCTKNNPIHDTREEGGKPRGGFITSKMHQQRQRKNRDRDQHLPP
jgi:hypothetical protein